MSSYAQKKATRAKREADEARQMLVRAHEMNVALAKEVVRLRDLLGDAEWGAFVGAGMADEELGCPWCHGLKDNGHKATCRAFPASG